MKRHQSILLSGAFALLMAIGLIGSAQAQTPTYDGAKFRAGVFGGANFNSIGIGGNNVIEIPSGGSILGAGLSKGTGFGGYGGVLAEYNTGDIIGVHFRIGYDDRRATISNGGRDWATRLTYISFESGLRVNLASPDFALTVGPFISHNLTKSFDYTPAQTEGAIAISDGELQQVKPTTFGLWGGVSYDIGLNQPGSGLQWYLTPFFEGSWMIDQKTASTPTQDNLADVWSTVSVRAGLQLKLGSAPVPPTPPTEPVLSEALPVVDVSLRTPPAGIIEARMLTEYFPLRNYIFFDKGTTRISSRYVTLRPAEAANFDEHALEAAPGTGGDAQMTRSQRQMRAYYNALNIYGERLAANPSVTLRLIGSAPDERDAVAMAESVKRYLVSTFSIDASRIATAGQTRAPNASGTRVTPKDDLPMVAEENLRVEIVPSDPSILAPVEIRSVQQEPGDNDLVLNVRTDSPVMRWTARVVGDGAVKELGPYYGPIQRIDAKELLHGRDRGSYVATVTMLMQNGRTVVKDVPFKLFKSGAPAAEGQRYSILFEYDDSKTVQTYEEFLRTTVAPQIPDGSTVYIHGHTDIIGEEGHNQDLSSARGASAESVLRDELRKLGRNVTFDTFGFGEDQFRAPFANTTPEGRYYNRTVIVDIVPGS